MDDDPLDPEEGAVPAGGAGRASTVERLLAVGQIDRARELVQQWLADEPDDPIALLMMAHVCVVDDAFEEALSALELVLIQEPDLDVAHRIRGVALLRLGRFADAEEALLTAIALDPADATSRETYARLLVSLERYRAGAQVIRDALELDPDDADLHALQAQLMLTVDPDDLKLSSEAAERAVRLDPGSDDAHAALGMVRLQQRRPDDAETSFRRALFINPNSALALHGLSRTTMTQYPAYRPMLGYSALLRRLGQTGQLAVILGAWALVQALRQLLLGIDGGEFYARLLSYGYLALCAYTWFATPIAIGLLKRRYPWLKEAGL